MNNIMEKEQREVQNELFSEVQTEKLENDLLQMNDLSEINISLDSEIENVIHEMNQLKLSYSNIQTQNLVELCKDSVLSTIVGQFGLASLFIESQDGGNVTTVHNFEKGITSTDSDELRFNELQNNKNADWKNLRKQAGYDEKIAQMHKEDRLAEKQYVLDEYTDNIISINRADIDHVISANEIELNSKNNLFLTQEERVAMGTADINLAYTKDSANRSKGKKKMQDWLDKERPEGITNEEAFGINRDLALEKDRIARKYVSKTVNKAAFQKYSKELLTTGGNDAAKMAAYSALGVIIHDFSLAVIEEIKFIISNKGTKSFSELFNHFKSRMANVMSELKNKWKEIFIGSFEQGIVAFLSNILIFVINLFATTLKKLVTMIRAGFVSVCQAVKIMINKPNNITQEEANYEAVKVLTTGMIGALSIGLSAAIEKFLQSIVCLQPLMMFPIPSFGREQRTVSDVIAVTLSSLAGGIVSTIVVYFMDTINNNIKKDKIQIQLLTQSQILVSMETMKSWLCLNNAYNYFTESITQATEKINLLNTQMNNFSMQMNVAAAETEDAMEKLRNFTKSLGE